MGDNDDAWEQWMFDQELAIRKAIISAFIAYENAEPATNWRARLAQNAE